MHFTGTKSAGFQDTNIGIRVVHKIIIMTRVKIYKLLTLSTTNKRFQPVGSIKFHEVGAVCCSFQFSKLLRFV